MPRQRYTGEPLDVKPRGKYGTGEWSQMTVPLPIAYSSDQYIPMLAVSGSSAKDVDVSVRREAADRFIVYSPRGITLFWVTFGV